MEDKKLSAGESELEVRGLQWLDTGHYRKKPPQFGYNPHDWNELCLVADAQRQIAEHKRLLAERDDAIKEWSALAIQRGEERDILQKKLDRFYSQSHGIPALSEIEKLRARVADLAELLGKLRAMVCATPENDIDRMPVWISTKHPVIERIDASLNPPQANSQEQTP